MSKLIDFASRREAHEHARKEKRLDSMRAAFRAARTGVVQADMEIATGTKKAKPKRKNKSAAGRSKKRGRHKPGHDS